MDAISKISPIIELLQKVYPFLIIVLIAGLYLWSWHRSGSAFFILNRFLFFIGGSTKLSDERLNEAWEKVKDHHSFIVKTGIKFESNKHISEVLDIIENKHIGLEELIAIRKYFTAKTCEIKAPNLKTTKLVSKLGLAFIALFSLIGVGFIVSDYAALSIRKTGTLFFTNNEMAHSWNLKWTINQTDCKDTALINADHDKQVICKLITEKNNNFIETTIFQQRLFGSIVVASSFLLILYILSNLDKATLANALQKKLSLDSPEQLDLFLKSKKKDLTLPDKGADD